MRISKDRISLSRKTSHLLYCCSKINPSITKRVTTYMNMIFLEKLKDVIEGKDVGYPIKKFKNEIIIDDNKTIQIRINERNIFLLQEAQKKDPYIVYKFRKHFDSILIHYLFKLKDKINTIPVGDAKSTQPIRCL